MERRARSVRPDERAVVVAERAASLARARGVDLPDDLLLWRLADGRPSVAPCDGEPEELGELLEGCTDATARRRLGAHYTPQDLARELAARAVGSHRAPQVGDPACGGGALLLAVARHLSASGDGAPTEVVRRLWAVDVDPVAVATTEASLAIWAGVPPPEGRCRVADALHEDLRWPPLDVVIGNPPFLTPLARSTKPSEVGARRRRARFASAAGAYTDTAALFLLLACRIARPGGTVALLQPLSVLGARDAAGVREAIAELGAIDEVWVPPRAFKASVEVCVPLIRIGEGGHPRWAEHLADAHGVPAVELVGTRRLGDVAEVVAGFRDEYYGVVGCVREAADLATGRPLVTAGLIELGRVVWGERPARVGGRTWDRPVVDAGALEGRAAAWVARTSAPKLLVATQTKVVEVVVDEDGELVPGVPVVAVLAPRDDLRRLSAALAAPAVTAWMLRRSAGSALTPRALKVSAPMLRDVPLPTDASAWDDGADAFEAGELDRFKEAMATAYRVGPEVGAWWRERAVSVWSPGVAAR